MGHDFMCQMSTIWTTNHNLCWERKNSVNAENNQSFIYMLFKLYEQV